MGASAVCVDAKFSEDSVTHVSSDATELEERSRTLNRV